MGRFFITMAAGFAELERNLIAERTSTALNHKKRNHKVYGTVPLGFNLEGDNLIENQQELAIVRLIQNKRHEGLSYEKIAKYLNSEQIATKKGGIWRPWTVQYILSNDLYKEVS
jgi:DNA invertase Pin-like site-specific DNA recombinase